MSPLFPPTETSRREVAPPGRVTVVGLGNVLTGDDAVGPTVIRTLDARWTVPEGVELVDAGTPGMDLASMLADTDAAIIVDSILGDAEPGTIRCYDRRMLVDRPLQPRTNPHAPGLAETLLSLELQGLGPSRVLLVGVIPDRVEIGVGLSESLRSVVDELVQTVVDALGALGRPPRPRHPAGEPDLWWMQSPALAGQGAAEPG